MALSSPISPSTPETSPTNPSADMTPENVALLLNFVRTRSANRWNLATDFAALYQPKVLEVFRDNWERVGVPVVELGAKDEVNDDAAGDVLDVKESLLKKAATDEDDLVQAFANMVLPFVASKNTGTSVDSRLDRWCPSFARAVEELRPIVIEKELNFNPSVFRYLDTSIIDDIRLSGAKSIDTRCFGPRFTFQEGKGTVKPESERLRPYKELVTQLSSSSLSGSMPLPHHPASSSSSSTSPMKVHPPPHAPGSPKSAKSPEFPSAVRGGSPPVVPRGTLSIPKTGWGATPSSITPTSAHHPHPPPSLATSSTRPRPPAGPGSGLGMKRTSFSGGTSSGFGSFGSGGPKGLQRSTKVKPLDMSEMLSAAQEASDAKKKQEEDARMEAERRKKELEDKRAAAKEAREKAEEEKRLKRLKMKEEKEARDLQRRQAMEESKKRKMEDQEARAAKKRGSVLERRESVGEEGLSEKSASSSSVSLVPENGTPPPEHQQQQFLQHPQHYMQPPLHQAYVPAPPPPHLHHAYPQGYQQPPSSYVRLTGEPQHQMYDYQPPDPTTNNNNPPQHHAHPLYNPTYPPPPATHHPHPSIISHPAPAPAVVASAPIVLNPMSGPMQPIHLAPPPLQQQNPIVVAPPQQPPQTPPTDMEAILGPDVANLGPTEREWILEFLSGRYERRADKKEIKLSEATLVDEVTGGSFVQSMFIVLDYEACKWRKIKRKRRLG
ncbi:hypothetical protein HDV05_006151 [Chytridiales sp. JEL 0842]|nr:hypothetical protein HDV05_006151 [Chytridiales sp. JEL 0842]